MAFEHYIRSGQKQLRCGFTTGTCAALAAKSAAEALFDRKIPEIVSVMTNKGILVEVPVFQGKIYEINNEQYAECSIIKDAGDDSDVTHGAEIISRVKLIKDNCIIIDGGLGVGRVTKPGLNQPVGNAAINSGPRRQIENAVREVLEANAYSGGAEIIVSIPKGVELASHTFNPMLGIEGGISVLGTSGIVEPMSEQALIDTIEVTINQALQLSDKLIITPGNYGETFMEKEDYAAYGIPVVKSSNFIGDTLDILVNKGLTEVLLVGHIGKFCKLAAGIMNTHSKYADGRAEVFTAYSAICGADTETCMRLMNAATSDACLEILYEKGLAEMVLEKIIISAQKHIEHRVKGAFKVGVTMFSNVYGFLGETEEARKIKEGWRK